MTARLDYEALVAGLPDAVVGVDAELRIVLWNPAAEALLGRSARRGTGRTLKEVFPPETSLDETMPSLTSGYALIVVEHSKPVGILTKIDVLDYVAGKI